VLAERLRQACATFWGLKLTYLRSWAEQPAGTFGTGSGLDFALNRKWRPAYSINPSVWNRCLTKLFLSRLSDGLHQVPSRSPQAGASSGWSGLAVKTPTLCPRASASQVQQPGYTAEHRKTGCAQAHNKDLVQVPIEMLFKRRGQVSRPIPNHKHAPGSLPRFGERLGSLTEDQASPDLTMQG
jgi:hypothetical protein